MSEHAKLTYKDHSVDIPVVIGTEGEIGLDLGAAKLGIRPAWSVSTSPSNTPRRPSRP